MSRIAKWKIEKTKVKVVFRLQFHATHVPQIGWDKLFISFIPADSGKATAKTTKAHVRNGTCKWADPIYETTRLLQDIKTKQYDEKLYKLVVAMGTSRSSILGESTINLADYADASKPSAVALPLHGCDFGTVLRVTVQLLTSKTGFREFEQQRELRESGLQTATDQHGPHESSGGRVLSSEETSVIQMDKVNARVRFREKFRELPSVEEEAGFSEEYADSAAGYDGSSNTSESVCAEKQDTSSTLEIDGLKSTMSGDLTTLSQSPQQEKGDPSDQRGTNDWVRGWSSDYSADNDLAATYEENTKLRASLEAAESSILALKQEVSSLQCHADEIGAETQKFAKELVAEITSGDQLAKEVSVLKLECSKLKDDLEQLTKSKMCPLVPSRETDWDHLFEELQLRWLKGLLVVEDKIRELQNKACFGYHERDLRLLQSDFEILLGLLQNLKPDAGLAISSLTLVRSDRANVKEFREMNLHKCSQFVPGTGFDAGLCQPELGVPHSVNIPGLVSQETGHLDATSAMQERIFELLRESDESKAERESLVKKMDQMECYYEALIQELEENQRQMMGELQNLRNEHSTCLYTVSSNKAEMERMRQDLSKQILKFEEEKHDFDSLSKELERRAITAEAALKRARLNYSIAVDQLQKDLELLSVQVLSMFETNESLIRQAFVDPSQPSIQGPLETVRNHTLDSEEFHVAKLQQCQNQYLGVKKQQLGGDILLEDLKRSLDIQGCLYQKVEEEISEMHLVNLYLEVFSITLQESLLEASSDIKLMQDKMDELTQQLELSNESRDSLMQRLHVALDDVHFLNEYKATCTANCNDLALQNQILEASLQNLNHENCHLKQKITECESLYQQNESKYEVCAAEKTELANLLKKESLENGQLHNEVSSLQEELENVKADFDEMAFVNKKLQNNVNLLENKLKNMLANYDKSFSGVSLLSESRSWDLESKDIASIASLAEELQQNFSRRVLQLVEERKGLVDERDMAQVSLNRAESDVVVMKQKFEHDMQGMVDKLNVSNSMMQKLQSELEAIAKRLKVSSDVEENYLQLHNELIADLNGFELELQRLTSRNRDLAEEISALETVNKDLGRSKMTVAELEEENQTLTASLQEKMEETALLALELTSLKENLHSVHGELCNEKSLRNELESKVCELASQLNEKHTQLLKTDEQKSELVHLKQLVLDLEQEKSNVCRLLLNSEECLAKAREESSSFFALESLLHEMHEFSIATDVRLVLTRSQYEAWVEEILHHLSSSDIHLAGLRKKHLDAETALNHCLASEARYIEGNAEMLASLDSLKSELEAADAENKALFNAKSLITAELQEYKKRTENLEAQVEEHLQQLSSTDWDLAELHKKHLNAETALNHCLASKAQCAEENAELLKSLESLRSELDAANGKNRGLFDTNSHMTAELQEYKKRAENLEALVEEHLQQLSSMDRDLAELHKKHLDAETALNDCLASKAQCVEENARLLKSLDSLRSELNAANAENRALFDTNSVITAELLECKKRAENLEAQVGEHLQQLSSTDRNLAELHKQHLDAEIALNHCLASKDQCTEENAKLLKSLDSLRSEFDAANAENKALLDKNSLLTADLQECKKRAQNIEASHCESESQLAHEVKKLKHLLVSSEEQIDILTILKEELDVKITVFRAKLDEQHAEMTLLEGCNDEVMKLQNQCNELSQRLSEQILKTEEFKNLSVHLKELKDKADAECRQAREKREAEGPPAAMQESLRIAFIKEQYETRVQELKQQLFISKKHSEELLWKLQDAVDEIENRKKSEASHLKKNEELGMKILEMEAELQSIISDKREKMKAYDLMKAELECSLISLECCKEDKRKLESSLKESNEEKSKVAAELNLTKELLEGSASPTSMQNKGNDESGKDDCMSDDPIVRNVNQQTPKAGTSGQRSLDTVSCNGPSVDPNCKELEGSVPIGEGDHSRALTDMECGQDVLACAGENRTRNRALVNQENHQQSDTKQLALINDHFRAQSLKSSMDHLNKELERMRNENLLDSQDDHHCDQQYPGFQRELMQLQKTNEELGSIFPMFNEYSDSGKALERVLALEMELAEALQTKKKSKVHFQSSFVKQHSDEEAVFKSFRDINELIKDMLELRGRYSVVETELKEMHDRYSQLSLQFAEVEGERQKLMMTLKNVRASRKPQALNHSSSASVADYS